MTGDISPELLTSASLVAIHAKRTGNRTGEKDIQAPKEALAEGPPCGTVFQ